MVNKKTQKRRCLRRGLKYHPLNKAREGWTFHHLNKFLGVYIPEDIHKSIKHTLKTGEGMDVINMVALGYLNGFRR